MIDAKTIEDELALYMAACYGASPLSKPQLAEVRQAFLSGIHWRDSQIADPGDCEIALRKLLGMGTDRN